MTKTALALPSQGPVSTQKRPRMGRAGAGEPRNLQIPRAVPRPSKEEGPREMALPGPFDHSRESWGRKEARIQARERTGLRDKE